MARGGPNVKSVIVMVEQVSFLDIPNFYMEKIAVGLEHPEGIVGLYDSPEKNLSQLAEVKNCQMRGLIFCSLDRPRHTKLIASTLNLIRVLEHIGWRCRYVYGKWC